MAFRLASLVVQVHRVHSRAFAKVRLVFYLEKCAGCNFIFYERIARARFARIQTKQQLLLSPAVVSYRSLIKTIDIISTFLCWSFKYAIHCF